ncbi:MAG: response regulator [Nitrospirota bacterium]
MSASRLLIIDHDPAVQHAVETALGPEGFEVTAVGDGLTALDMALASAPDVILAEYRMEGINVFRFIEKLKHKNALNGVALLLLVNPGDTYDELTLRLVGVTDFLRKPISPKEMLERVKRYRPVPISVPAAPAHIKTAEPEPQKVEDLLGWSHDAEPSPFSELSQDRSTGLDFSLAAPDQMESAASAAETAAFLDRNEITPNEHPVVASDTEQAFASLAQGSLAAPESASTELSQPLFTQPELPRQTTAAAHPIAERTGDGRAPIQPQTVERLAQDIAQQVVEKVAWDVVPDLARQSLERIVTDVVERVVWDIVPTIAEAAIKKELERLTRDND